MKPARTKSSAIFSVSYWFTLHPKVVNAATGIQNTTMRLRIPISVLPNKLQGKDFTILRLDDGMARNFGVKRDHVYNAYSS